MSKTLKGNVLGCAIAVLGCVAGYGAYRISFEWGIVIGVGVALFGATIISPKVVHDAATEFKGSFGDLIPLGRRSSDGVAKKMDTSKDDA